MTTCEAYMLIDGSCQCGNCGYLAGSRFDKCPNCGAEVDGIVDEGDGDGEYEVLEW